MSKLLLFNKPFGTLSQFSGELNHSTLASFIPYPHLYPAGRLDKDSEGLLLLTDDGVLQARIADPKYKQPKVYWAQLEGEISDLAITQLCEGVTLKDGLTRPAKAKRINPPQVWCRTPPIRERKNIPTCWIELVIREGKNRQVRRMTAAVGYPTLRLIRSAIGSWELGSLQPGEHLLTEYSFN